MALGTHTIYFSLETRNPTVADRVWVWTPANSIEGASEPSARRLRKDALTPEFLYLSQHRVSWVRERGEGRDFLGEADTVVTGITITPLG